MPVQMTTCPHCGAPNSAKRRLCFECERELAAPAEPEVKRRALRSRETANAVATEAPAPTARQTQAPAPAPMPAPAVTRAEAPVTPVRQTAPRPAAPQVKQITRTPTETPGERAARVKAEAQAANPTQKSTPAGASPLFGATLRQRVQFYQQLHNLLKSGIPLALCLNYLENNIAYTLRPMLRDLIVRVQQGGLLSIAMGAYPNIFPEWEKSMVEAGEKGGTLPEAMQDIAEILEMEADMRSQVNTRTFQAKATFFVFILVIMVVIGAARSGGDIAKVIQNVEIAGMAFMGFLLAVLVAKQMLAMWSRTRQGSKIAFAISSRTPLIGPMMRNMMQLRFTRVLGALWHAGVSPIDALETAARASGNPHVINQVADCIPSIGKGATVSDVLEKTVALPREAMYLLRSGETSGSMVEALKSAADYIRMDLEAQVKTLPMKAQLLFYGLIAPLVGAFIIYVVYKYFDTILNMQF